MYYGKKKFYRLNSIKRKQNKKYDVHLDQEELTVLIQLLEFAESEIQRTFKRFTKDDIDMKEIYYYYRHSGRQLRRSLREKRGF